MLGTGKHWQQTINGITKIKTGRIGEELQTLGNNYKYWLTLWGSGEIFGNQLQTLAKHCGTKTNIGEELQTLWSSGETLGKLWGNFGSNWVLGTGYWQETIKGITKVNIVEQRGNFGETLGATTNIGEQWLGRGQDLCFFSKSIQPYWLFVV